MTKVVVGIIERKNENGENEYLLISSKKSFGKYSGYYYPPGGHLEGDESQEMALIREIREELGISVIPQKMIAETDSDVKDQTTYWWECEIDSYDFKIDEKEIKDARFFTLEEMKNIDIWPATKSFFEKYIK